MAITVPPEEQGLCRWCCIYIIFLAFILGLAASFALVSIFASKKAHYYAAIDAISNLDLALHLEKPELDQVEFELILGVQSRSPFSSECYEPGTNVIVMYLGVQIASGSTDGQACAQGWHPEQLVRIPVAAHGTRARLSGPVLDCLAADVRPSVAVFDISLRTPLTPGGNGKLVVCRGRHVGGVVKALLTPCEELKSS